MVLVDSIDISECRWYDPYLRECCYANPCFVILVPSGMPLLCSMVWHFSSTFGNTVTLPDNLTLYQYLRERCYSAGSFDIILVPSGTLLLCRIISLPSGMSALRYFILLSTVHLCRNMLYHAFGIVGTLLHFVIRLSLALSTVVIGIMVLSLRLPGKLHAMPSGILLSSSFSFHRLCSLSRVVPSILKYSSPAPR